MFSIGRFRAIFYWRSICDDQTSSIDQGVTQMPEYDAWTRQFVISIRDQYGIHRRRMCGSSGRRE